jgi:cell division protein FtsQ
VSSSDTRSSSSDRSSCPCSGRSATSRGEAWPVAGQRRRTQARPPRPRAAVLAQPWPKVGRLPGAGLARSAPSRRSLLVGVGLVAIAACAYAAVRETSTFAIGRVEVAGAPAETRGQVQRALAPLRGTSLLALDGGALARRVEALPTIVSVGYDRAFPHTLRVSVVPERAVAVLHRGKETWLVSARGRVISRIPNLTYGSLARVWVPRATVVEAGAFLAPETGGTTARALALAARFPARIAVASLVHDQLVFKLRSGVELRLGDPTDVRLKLAIVRHALRHLPPGSAYVDVSVPERPVAGPTNPQLSS